MSISGCRGIHKMLPNLWDLNYLRRWLWIIFYSVPWRFVIWRHIPEDCTLHDFIFKQRKLLKVIQLFASICHVGPWHYLELRLKYGRVLIWSNVEGSSWGLFKTPMSLGQSNPQKNTGRWPRFEPVTSPHCTAPLRPERHVCATHLVKTTYFDWTKWRGTLYVLYSRLQH